MKKILYFVIGLILVSPAMATTKTVGKSGADFTSIQAAINSFTQAEITDGTPDVVEIIDGAEYNEQVVLGGLIANPDNQSPGYLNAAIELGLNRDSLTIRGANPNQRPKINPTSNGKSYGVFTNDPGDNFVATLSFMGKDFRVENVEILQSSLIDADQYAVNGQAGNMTFKNVLFAHSGATQPGEALFNFNNAVDIAGKGFDNSYTFEDCTFDAAVNGQRNDFVDTFYFHGYSASEATEAGVNPDDVPCVVSFNNCKFLNGETATMIRGRAQANHISFKNCYIAGNKNGLVGAGKGSFTVEDCVFYNNQNVETDSNSDIGAVSLNGRDGFTPQLTVRNSLFVKNLSGDADVLDGGIGLDSRAAAIRIRNDGTDPDFTIENCTFVDNPVAIRAADKAVRPRKGTVNNCAFVGSNVAVFTADDFADSYLAGGEVTVLNVSGSGNVFDSNHAVVENQDLLPNVKINGTSATVTFTNAAINEADPFDGPPYLITTPTGVGADLSTSSSIPDFMLF